MTDEHSDAVEDDSSSLARDNSFPPGACDLQAVRNQDALMSDDKMHLGRTKSDHYTVFLPDEQVYKIGVFAFEGKN